MGTWISLYGLCRSTEYEFKMQAAGTYSNALARSDYQEICYEKMKRYEETNISVFIRNCMKKKKLYTLWA